jgi:hypothetical protein
MNLSGVEDANADAFACAAVLRNTPAPPGEADNLRQPCCPDKRGEWTQGELESCPVYDDLRHPAPSSRRSRGVVAARIDRTKTFWQIQ